MAVHVNDDGSKVDIGYGFVNPQGELTTGKGKHGNGTSWSKGIHARNRKVKPGAAKDRVLKFKQFSIWYTTDVLHRDTPEGEVPYTLRCEYRIMRRATEVESLGQTLYCPMGCYVVQFTMKINGVVYTPTVGSDENGRYTKVVDVETLSKCRRMV